PQHLQHRAQIQPYAHSGNLNHLDSRRLKLRNPCRLSLRSTEHQHISACRPRQLRIQRRPQRRIQHHSQQPPAPRKPTPVGQRRIVGQHCPHAGQYCIRRMTHPLHFGPRLSTSNPVRLPLGSLGRGRRHHPVRRQPRLKRHQRRARPNPSRERLIHLVRFRLAHTHCHLNSR